MTLKAARWVLRQLGTVQGRCRPRPIRGDQRQRLGAEALEMLARLGLGSAQVGGTEP